MTVSISQEYLYIYVFDSNDGAHSMKTITAEDLIPEFYFLFSRDLERQIERSNSLSHERESEV